jgi:hypothetical protein
MTKPTIREILEGLKTYPPELFDASSAAVERIEAVLRVVDDLSLFGLHTDEVEACIMCRAKQALIRALNGEP